LRGIDSTPIRSTPGGSSDNASSHDKERDMGKNKSDLADAVYTRQPDLTKKGAADLVDAVLDVLKEAIQNGETVKVSGFGMFLVRQKSERAGRNPKTGEAISIASRRALTFKPSAVLKAALNARGQ